MSPDRGWQDGSAHFDNVKGRESLESERELGLERELEAFSLSRTTFTAEDEEKPVLLERLPDEILMYIITLVAAPRGQRCAKIVRQPITSTPATANAGIRTGDDAQDTAHAHGPNKSFEGNEHDLVAESSTNAATLSPDLLSKTNELHTANVVYQSSRSGTIGVGMVLGGADYVSIEHLSRVCWKIRQMTQTWRVWKFIVQGTYYHPQLPPKVSIPTLVAERHENDWQRAFLRQPRVRLNGAYIAAYHYTRPGTHPDNVWVRVDHVVEFYRTLRFLPDGHVLSLLTTDPPSETLRRMEPSLRLKGFAIGRWTVHPDGLSDDELHARPLGPKVVVDDLNNKSLAGYIFRLILKLDFRKGRWDRMEMLEYESINLKTGEVCPLPMNHKKPFYFSVVRSYGI